MMSTNSAEAHLKKVERRTFLKAVGLGTLALAASQGCDGSINNASRPNVVFILCDDLNDAIEHLGGHPQARTPNIERLMRRGSTFRRAYSNAPLCAPARASLISGLYPHTTGYFGTQRGCSWQVNDTLKRSKAFMRHFRDSGYYVAGTGKIFHQNNNDRKIWAEVVGDDTYGVPHSFGPYPWDGDQPGFFRTRHPDQPLPDSTLPMGCTGISLASVPEIRPLPEAGAQIRKSWFMDFNHQNALKRDTIQSLTHSDAFPFKYESETNRDLMPDEWNTLWFEREISKAHD
ncbi:MAG: sulfatase-like hydrolase/transferase, partial [Planctomycetes bacterium]|nr:sulfatase-like hydrolase/transferase [Planctomycetota bacterium]